MRLSQLGIYLAECGFMGLVFALAGLAARALWDTRRGERN